jgi:hypothetical protein
MGLFTRRDRAPRDGPASAPAHGQQTKQGFFTRNRGHESKGPLVMSMATRPTFGQWLKVTWIDILTMFIMGLIGLGVSPDIIF